MIKSKILMIGANLKGVETELKHAGIRCTELISHCSPFSMIGKRDERFTKLCKDIDDMPVHLDIKKNLAQMLSKDPAGFVQNYNSVPYGKNVDYSNPAEYIIVSNTSLAYDIYSNGEYVYTANADNVFSRIIKNDVSYQKVDLSRDEFCLNVLYEEFIDTILKEYDSEHIILIKTNPARFYFDDGEIKRFDEEYKKLGEIICKADKLFTERTGCIAIDEAYCYLPTGFAYESVLPAAELSSECAYDISRVIAKVILDKKFPEKSPADFLDINDIAELYCEYEAVENKTLCAETVRTMISNGCSLPIRKAVRFRANNEAFIAGYPYVCESLKHVSADGHFYIELGKGVFIVLSADGSLLLTDVGTAVESDVLSVIENGYVCRIAEADRLCGSLPFYIERARRGDGQRPVKIVFHSPREFAESLNYIDWADLIENERFLLTLQGDEPDTNGHMVSCDLSFFFDPNVKICELDNGLGDQISRYIFAKRLEDYTGSEIYYDDLVYYTDYIMNDREIDRIIKENLNRRLFSNIFTRKLLLNFKIGDVVPDKLAENGLREMTVVANNNEENGDAVKKCNKICLCTIQHDVIDKILGCGFCPLYFNYYIRPEWLMTLRPFELREYLEFPERNGKNKEIEEIMLNCDAVAIQMRRGDFVRLGWESDTAFYAEALEKLSHIEDYPNKKFFVFSDDIPWIKAHSAEMGLDSADGEVFYIDHNKNEDSLFDMYLISLAKVVIGSASGFVRTGALFGTRCEDLICSTERAVEMFELVGKKTRHNIKLSINKRPNYAVGKTVRNNAQRENQNYF